MMRRYLTLACAMALVCALTGCWGRDNTEETPQSSAPVTPTESTAPSESLVPEPTVSPTDNYHADGGGQVDLDGDGKTEDEHSAGDTIKDAVDDAGNAVQDAGEAAKDTVDEAGRMVRDAARGAGQAVERAGDSLTGQK